jgi:hypothetical protein
VEARQGKSSKLFWLPVFGFLFALLFLGLGVTGGFGSPRVPPGAVAVVEGVPPGQGEVSRAELRGAIASHAALSEEGTVPRPGSKEYTALQEAALSELLTAIWLAGQAEELGLPVHKKHGQLDIAQLQRVIEPKLREEAPEPSNPQPYFTEIDLKFPGQWLPRTHCRDGFVVEQCEEFIAGHLASPCYEAHPTEPVEACPAPVGQRVSAAPGTYTERLPTGKGLPQGPIPVGG